MDDFGLGDLAGYVPDVDDLGRGIGRRLVEPDPLGLIVVEAVHVVVVGAARTGRWSSCQKR